MPWIDPLFEEAIPSASLIMMGEVVASTPAVTHVRIERVFAGTEAAGATIAIARCEVVGVGHANDTMPVGTRFAFVLQGHYRSFTDTYWWFRITDGTHIHMAVRDPFTRAYFTFDELAETVAAMRDRSRAPQLLDRVTRELRATPVVAEQPIDANTQLVALELLANLDGGERAGAAIPYLATTHYQIRWSAVRAIAPCIDPLVTEALMRLVAQETAPPVQHAIVDALARAGRVLDREQLAALLPTLHGQSIHLASSIMNPIFNELPAPRASLEALLARTS